MTKRGKSPRRGKGATDRRKRRVAAPATEILFLVEEDPEGGYTARSLGESIFTQAETLAELRERLRDAVRCHFPDEGSRPRAIRLHLVRDEVLAL